jgi:hypothetical protein
MIQLIIDNFITIAGAILTIVFGGYVTYRIYRKNRIAEASTKFRNKILTELQGLYPVTQYWEQRIFPRFSQSIVKIESIATEFRHFIPFYRKRAFDATLKNYCDYCNKITWNEVAAYAMYKNSMDTKDKGPREQFKNIVEYLLSFANKD